MNKKIGKKIKPGSFIRKIGFLFPVPDINNVIERQQTFVFLYVSLGFLTGITFYLVTSILPWKDFIAVTHSLQAIGILVLLILRQQRAIQIRTALFGLVFSIQTSISLDMYHIAATADTTIGIPEVLGCWALLCILIPLSITVYWRPLPYILTTTNLIMYALCVWITDNTHLENMMPLLALSIIVLMFMGDKLVQVVCSLHLKEQDVSAKQKRVLEFFNMKEEELFRLIHLMRRNKLSDKQKNELLDLLGEQTKISVLEVAAGVVEKKQKNLSNLDTAELGLSPYEKEICLMIIEGTGTAEIARRLKKSVTAITSTRGNIRSKLGLSKPDNLQEALLRLVNDSSGKV